MNKQMIKTNRAPRAIGPYSQAIRVGNTVYLSGQIPFDPETMQLVSGDIAVEIGRVLENLKAVAESAGASLAQAVKITIYLTDLAHFPKVNEIMGQYFSQPYPARVTVGVAQLAKGARVEIDCILVLERS